MLNDGEPRSLMPYDRASDYVAGLNATDDDGWSYKVIMIPANGLAYIAVYDEAGKFIGPL